jgi:peptidyl-prolyl cis-trans isomerase C
LFQDVTGPAADSVTDDQLPAYFEGHRAEFVTPEQRHLRNIVVATKDQADQVYQKAKAGSEFAALVTESSLDDGTRDKQGDLGVVAASRLEPEYAAAAFAAPGGSVFGPVRTRFGWNVGQVTEVVPGAQSVFEQIKDKVRDALRSERALDASRTWLAERIRQAHVEYADDYRPADPDAPPDDLGASVQPSPAARR